MPPVVLGIAAAIEVLGIPAATATSIAAGTPIVGIGPWAEPLNNFMRVPRGNVYRPIHGLLAPLNKPSKHLRMTQADGSNHVDGRITFHREGAEQEIIPALPGVPIFSGDFQTEIGRITEAYIEDDAVMIRGEVLDTLSTRFHLCQQQCGLCMEMKFVDAETFTLEPGVVHTPKVRPHRVFVTIPGQSAFDESNVRFTDPEIHYPYSHPDPSLNGWWLGR